MIPEPAASPSVADAHPARPRSRPRPPLRRPVLFAAVASVCGTAIGRSPGIPDFLGWAVVAGFATWAAAELFRRRSSASIADGPAPHRFLPGLLALAALQAMLSQAAVRRDARAFEAAERLEAIPLVRVEGRLARPAEASRWGRSLELRDVRVAAGGATEDFPASVVLRVRSLAARDRFREGVEENAWAVAADAGSSESLRRAVARSEERAREMSADEAKLARLDAFPRGAVVAAWGRLQVPRPAGSPGTYDARAVAEGRGLGASVTLLRPEDADVVSADPRPHERALGVLDGAAAWMRANVRDRLAPREAGVALGLLLGDRAGISDELEEAFRRTGLTHILSVSGVHTTILAGALLLAASALGLRVERVFLLVVVGLGAYVALTGFRPPAVRAWTMTAFVLGGRAMRREGTEISGLSFAVVVQLAVDPRNFVRVDWILSNLCMASMLLLAPTIRELPPERVVEFLESRARAAWSSVATALAIFVGMLPVQLELFGQTSLVGLAIQAPALVWSGACLFAALGAALLGWIPVLGAVAGGIAQSLTWLYLEAVDLAASPSFAVAKLAPLPFGLVVVHYLALAAVVGEWTPRKGPGSPRFGRNGARIRAVVLSALVATAFLAPRMSRVWRGLVRDDASRIADAGHPDERSSPTVDFEGDAARTGTFDVHSLEAAPGEFDLFVVDVGQGDGLVLRFPDGRVGVVDAGREAASDAAHPVVALLERMGVESLAFAMVSHADADHSGGLDQVFARFDVQVFFHGSDDATTGEYRELLDAVRREGSRMEPLRAGDRIEGFGGVALRVLNPEDDQQDNDGSVALIADHGEIEFLLTGDITMRAEARILARGLAEDVDVLKVAHHGSASSSTEEFLAAFDPELALVSAGRRNLYGHPSPGVLRRLEAAGARVVRTDLEGTIRVRSDGRSARVELYRPGGR